MREAVESRSRRREEVDRSRFFLLTHRIFLTLARTRLTPLLLHLTAYPLYTLRKPACLEQPRLHSQPVSSCRA